MALHFRHGVAVGVLFGALAGVVTTAAAIEPVDERDASVAGTPGAAGTLGAVAIEDDAPPPFPRNEKAYAGLGTWVDVFDFDPAYTNGAPPAVTPDDVDAMADAGVGTIYLQATRLDDRTPTGLTDPVLVSQFLERAHARGVRVVGWYLPKLGDLEADLERIRMVVDYEVFGHRFDGVALDIEDTTTVPDPTERNARLIELSQRADELVGEVPLGAIVLPPPLLEVVNEQYWPAFPWAELAPHYDVWLPMSYWSQRTTASGYRDGYTYNEASTRRIRELVGDATVPVHGIGGIGNEIDEQQLTDFARSLADTGSVGGSIYDWATLSESSRQHLDELFATGPAADLPGG